MVAEDRSHVVGGHTAPIRDGTEEVLTNYRDAMQWVCDRTLEGLQQLMMPYELVESAKPPERFARLDYLADNYASVSVTALDLYVQDLGWFVGDLLSIHREGRGSNPSASPTWQGRS